MPQPCTPVTVHTLACCCAGDALRSDRGGRASALSLGRGGDALPRRSAPTKRDRTSGSRGALFARYHRQSRPFLGNLCHVSSPAPPLRFTGPLANGHGSGTSSVTEGTFFSPVRCRCLFLLAKMKNEEPNEKRGRRKTWPTRVARALYYSVVVNGIGRREYYKEKIPKEAFLRGETKGRTSLSLANSIVRIIE